MKNKTAIDSRVWELIQKLAGDKLDKVKEKANQLIKDGKQPGRGYADALEIFKCLPKPETEDVE